MFPTSVFWLCCICVADTESDKVLAIFGHQARNKRTSRRITRLVWSCVFLCYVRHPIPSAVLIISGTWVVSKRSLCVWHDVMLYVLKDALALAGMPFIYMIYCKKCFCVIVDSWIILIWCDHLRICVFDGLLVPSRSTSNTIMSKDTR